MVRDIPARYVESHKKNRKNLSSVIELADAIFLGSLGTLLV